MFFSLWIILEVFNYVSSQFGVKADPYILQLVIYWIRLSRIWKMIQSVACSQNFYFLFLLNFKTYSRSLRSSCKEYLVVPRSRLKTYGDRAFSIAGPKLWNDLPLEIRKCASVATFKQSLKTFLFKLAYRLWDSFCFKMFLIYIVDNLGYIWIILYIVDIL